MVPLSVYIYIYIYSLHLPFFNLYHCLPFSLYLSLYIYIEREQEREREKEGETGIKNDKKINRGSIYIYIYIFIELSLPFSHYSFSHQRKLRVFHWILSNRKSPQVSRTLLGILAVFINAVVWMVSTRPPTSKSSKPFFNPLVTVPKVPITIHIIVTFMFHSFFNSLARSRYLSLFTFFQFYYVVSRDSKVDYFAYFLF